MDLFTIDNFSKFCQKNLYFAISSKFLTFNSLQYFYLLIVKLKLESIFED